MPAVIHERAMRLLPEMKKTYPPKKAKQVAFATATQQAYAKKQAPKKFHGKPFGTPAGKREAKQKYDKPPSAYKSLKVASALEMVDLCLSKIAADESSPLAPGALALLEKLAKEDKRPLVKHSQDLQSSALEMLNLVTARMDA